jgi:predicted amidohydrolase
MTKTTRVAAVQMIATPAPVTDRLQRAETLIQQAVQDGAQLVVLPEVFNTGYGYSDENYALAETQNGVTVQWMTQQARTYHIHLAGSLLLLDGDHVYNAAFLVAPDGKTWRYNKHYPFVWERAYFRDGETLTIADTDLGRIGLLICWDSAHAELWQRYAGRVDMIIIPSCPPVFNRPTLRFADGTSTSFETDSNHFADIDIHNQARWLGVPVIHSAGAGQFESVVPLPKISVGAFARYDPQVLSRLNQADSTYLVAEFGKHTKIIDAKGQAVAIAQDGDHVVTADVQINANTPAPSSPQPPMLTQKATYWMVDVVGTPTYIPLYQHKLRQQHGKNMAPLSPHTKLWGVGLAIALLVGWLLGKRR